MKSIVRMLAVATAVVSLGAQADDADDLLNDLADLPAVSDSSDAEAGEASSDDGGEVVEEGEAAAAGVKIPKIKQKLFHILPFCRRLEGQAEVLIPGQQAWRAIEEGKYYPLGSVYRSVGRESNLVIMFGPTTTVELRGDASFSTRAQPLGEKSRSIGLVSGTINVKLPSDLPEGLFFVTAPGFTAKNLAGNSRYTYRKTGDGDEAIVRCVTQTMAVEGPHFKAPAMRAANEIRIRTSQDRLMTGLYGSRGDVLVRLDQGLESVADYGTGNFKVEPKFLDWKLSPRTAVRIHRAKPALGKRMAVTTMTFNERGELCKRRAFTEEMVEVNSGELGPTTKKEREALAKRAAEITKSQEASDAAAETSDADVSDAGADGEAGKSDDDGLDL